MLSHFSHVRLFATLWTIAFQAPLYLGFSRQEYWSGLPFPSPMHKSESEVAQSCPTLRDPMDCSLPGSSVHGIFQARVLEWGAITFSHEWVYLFVKMWLMKTVQSLGYHTVRVQLSRRINSKDITQSINQLEGAIQTLPCRTLSGRWLDKSS